MTEAAQIVAACGYAKPYMAEVWGVVRDYDRSGEAPVQIFTPRNSSGFRFDKGFARPPDGLRVNFRDAARDYDARQITVFRDGVTADTGRLEQITYEGLVTEAEVVARARYDQRQTDLRNTFYAIEAPAEAIVCRRGSLVGVQHDMLTERAGAARVIGVERDAAGLVTALRLDQPVPVLSEPGPLDVADMLAVDDVLALGTETGAAIRRRGAASTTHRLAVASGSTDRIVLAMPADPTGVADDVLVAVGPLGSELRRLIVWEIAPRSDLTFTLTMVDEAQGII